eukprot:10950150-Heterocapsa_arctica.AAC.1
MHLALRWTALVSLLTGYSPDLPEDLFGVSGPLVDWPTSVVEELGPRRAKASVAELLGMAALAKWSR